MKKFLLISLLFISYHNLQAAQLPADFSAVYSLQKYGTLVAEMHLSLHRNDNQIIYKSHSKARGMLALFSDDSVDEISQLRWNDQLKQTQLQNYQFIRKNKSRKNQQFSIIRDDQNQTMANGTYSGNTFEFNTPDIIWDRLSVQLALAADLGASNKIKKKFSYTIVDKGLVNHYHFEYVNNQIVHVNDEQYDAIKIKRTHKSGNRITYLWLAKTLDFLPVKIDQYRKGELHMSMTLSKFIRQKKL